MIARAAIFAHGVTAELNRTVAPHRVIIHGSAPVYVGESPAAVSVEKPAAVLEQSIAINPGRQRNQKSTAPREEERRDSVTPCANPSLFIVPSNRGVGGGGRQEGDCVRFKSLENSSRRHGRPRFARRFLLFYMTLPPSFGWRETSYG